MTIISRLPAPGRVCMIILAALIYAAPAAAQDGEAKMLGRESVTAFTTIGAERLPSAIGVRFSRSLFAGLPTQRNTTSRCFDANGDGKMAKEECEGDTEVQLSLPNVLTERGDVPFGWIGMNWNPDGHPPWEVYGLPHFDFQFYMVSHADIDAHRAGPCGFFIHCEDFKRATKPIPQKYVHADHVSVGATVQKMGDHLIDTKAPEFRKPPVKFTHTFIFGADDGHITFYEPMITVEYLLSRPNNCIAIKQPQAWERAGYYPTNYCIRYLAAENQYTISLENFIKRKAE